MKLFRAKTGGGSESLSQSVTKALAGQPLWVWQICKKIKGPPLIKFFWGKTGGGGPFSYSGTEPRSGMIQVYWSGLQYIPRTNSLPSRGSTKHI